MVFSNKVSDVKKSQNNMSKPLTYSRNILKKARKVNINFYLGLTLLSMGSIGYLNEKLDSVGLIVGLLLVYACIGWVLKR